ncbi:MAG: hypothetical protein K0S41_4348 [Anaerocolumna sp.]|jgi:hypothetical protein|nr:hypothetical protein [Anaerocolumna sp.]
MKEFTNKSSVLIKNKKACQVFYNYSTDKR